MLLSRVDIESTLTFRLDLPISVCVYPVNTSFSHVVNIYVERPTPNMFFKVTRHFPELIFEWTRYMSSCAISLLEIILNSPNFQTLFILIFKNGIYLCIFYNHILFHENYNEQKHGFSHSSSILFNSNFAGFF